MNHPTPLRLSTLAAGLLLASSAFGADGSLSGLVYAGGEAMAPEAEARMTAQISVPGGVHTRDEVLQQLATARQVGALPEAGEVAETPRVLTARADFNERQTREILAGYEAERVRLAAVEAERVRLAAEEAERARLAAAAAAAPTAAAQDAATTAQPTAAAPAVDATATQPMPAPADKPVDLPTERPGDRPAMAPVETTVTRPADLATEKPADKP